MKNEKRFSLENKTILITGAAGFLGTHFSQALLAAGARLIIADTNIKQLKKLEEALADDQRVLAVPLDITSIGSITKCLGRVLKKFKRIDGLVNNAVLRAPTQSFFERNFSDFRKATDVNINGTFLITQQVAKIMRDQKSGVIVNIGSIYGLVGGDQSIYPTKKINAPDYYSLHKGAMINFTRYLATLLGEYGIRANAISPGGIFQNQEKEFVKRYSKKTPLGRMAQGEEMCAALIYLLSDESSYVTGHNLVVDGGWTAW